MNEGGNMKSVFTTIPRGAGVISMLLAGSAMAQNEESARSVQTIDEIVVTGTSIRGIAPESSQVVGVDSAAIEATGTTSTVELLATVPQLSDFQTLPSIQSTNQVQVNSNSVNLRQLPGSTTLLLLDGRRVPGAGIKSTDPDPDFLPPSVIERVEAVLDGGSAIYGADAVGGVVNFITRKRFEGVQLDGRYGVADEYEQYDANAMVGTDWESGSAYVAYNYAYHDSIYGRDRDFVQRKVWATGQPLDLVCIPGNATVTVSGVQTIYGLPGLTANAANRCDVSDNRTFYNDDERHSAFASLTQKIGEDINLDVTGFYTQRDRSEDLGPRTATATIPPTSPFYRSTGDVNAGRPQSVAINFGPAIGFHTPSTYVMDVWGVEPTLTWGIGANWQLRVLMSYGEGKTETDEYNLSALALGTGVALGTINPYDIASNSATVLAPVINSHIFGQSWNKLGNARAVFDGPLFSVSGGEVRAAVGVEYNYEDYKARAGTVAPGNEAALPLGGGDRDVYAGFLEVNVPLVGANNSVTGIHSLTASLSGRYDDYSDFGDTFNPKVGVNYRPVEWINVRANWGESFTAPSLATSAAVDNSLLLLQGPILVNPFQPPTTPVPLTLAGQGGDANTQPQEAESYSVGVDFDLPFAEGLSLSLTYYNVKIEDIIGLTPVFTSQFYLNYPEYFVMSPTQAQAAAFAAQFPGGLNVAAPVLGPGAPPIYMLIDGKRRNLGATKVDGVDFSGNYAHPTGFGSIYARWDTTYRLSRQNSPRTGAPFDPDSSDESPKLRATATLGTTISNLTAQATYRYLDGFEVPPSTANNFQTSVASFETVDLFFKYDFEAGGLFKGVSLTANVNNVLDEDPSTYQGIFGVVYDGYANGGTVGRLYQVGLKVNF